MEESTHSRPSIKQRLHHARGHPIGTDLFLGLFPSHRKAPWKEKVKIDKVLGHGGFFKTEGVGQVIMAAALNVPVSVMETAGEGGAWGIALLAAYMKQKEDNETFDTYLDKKVFAGEKGSTLAPSQEDLDGFATFMERYKKGLDIERTAVDALK